MCYTLNNSGRCSCVFAQVPIQPITWQQLKAFRLCRCGAKVQSEHWKNVASLSVADELLWVVPQTADKWDFQHMQGLQRTVPKKGKVSNEQKSCAGNCRRVKGERTN